jgi:hypothetical protein
LLRLSGLGLALLLPLLSLKLPNIKMRLAALVLSVLIPLSLARTADLVLERYPWLLDPLQGDPDRNVDYVACSGAYETFGLGKYNLPKTIVAAEIRQEQGSIRFKDLVEDQCVSYFGETPFGMDLSFGPAQMKKSNIIRLAREYPHELKVILQESGNSGSSVNLKAALERKNSAMLVAAYFKSVIMRLEQDKPASLDSGKLKNETIATLWKSGMPEFRVRALAMSYCPAWVHHPVQVLDQISQLDNAKNPNATQGDNKGE